MSVYASRPTSSFGYWRGVGSEGPLAYGQGSGRGPALQGAGMFPQGSGPATMSQAGWTPTVTYLFVLILAEMIVFKILAKVLG